MRTQWWQRLIKISGILATIGALGGGILYGAAPHPPKTPASLTTITDRERFLTQPVASGNPPGLSVVVVKEGQIVSSGLPNTVPAMIGWVHYQDEVVDQRALRYNSGDARWGVGSKKDRWWPNAKARHKRCPGS